ncbi:MAG: hypothetical protein OXT09_25765 [Myxococcales bacterium]|nr:hypothetical protein [Myxococcales bacterium]
MAGPSSNLLDDEEEGGGGGRPGFPVDPGRVWQSAKSGWKILPIGIGIGALAGVLAALLLVSHTYKSQTILIWEPVAGRQGPGATRDLSTQAGILKMPVIMDAVRKRMNMPKMSLKTLSKQIEVWFDTQSNLVTVETSGATAKSAAKLAQTLIDAFMEHQRMLGRTRSREIIDSITVDLQTATARRDTARTGYDSFRAQHDILDYETESRQALDALNALRAERDELRADVTALGARAEELGAVAKSRPRMRAQSSTRSDPNALRAAQLKSDLAAARSRLSPDHPRLAQLQAQIASLERASQQGDGVVSNVMMAPDPEFETARSNLANTRAERAAKTEREKSLGEAIADAERRVAKFAAVEGPARKLIAEVEATTERVQELQAALNKAREAERAPPVEFRVLTPPVVPDYPESSSRKKVAAALTMLGTMIAVLFLILRPARGGRIYTAREAAFWSNAPVVGTTSWPRRQQAFFSFVDELNDSAMLSNGTTLVVGAGPSDVELANTLAGVLGPQPAPSTMDTEGKAKEAQSTALARRAAQATFFAWPGESEGPSFRRAARMADRVLVVLSAGSETFARMATLRSRLGRETDIAVVVVGMPDDLMSLPDRVGDVQSFWRVQAKKAA